MQRSREVISGYVSKNVANCIIDEFCGLGFLEHPPDHQDCYMAGFFGLYEFCEVLHHPFVNDAFLGAVWGNHLLLAKHMISSGAYAVCKAILTTLDLPMSVYLRSIRDRDPKYELYKNVSTNYYSNSVVGLVDCKTDWNVLLTASCHINDYQVTAFSIQQGATQCYMCQRSIAEHASSCGYKTRWQRFTTQMTARRSRSFHVYLASIFGISVALKSVCNSPVTTVILGVPLCVCALEAVDTLYLYSQTVDVYQMKCGHKVNDRIRY